MLAVYVQCQRICVSGRAVKFNARIAQPDATTGCRTTRMPAGWSFQLQMHQGPCYCDISSPWIPLGCGAYRSVNVYRAYRMNGQKVMRIKGGERRELCLARNMNGRMNGQR
jgi:hypothetical protein